VVVLLASKTQQRKLEKASDKKLKENQDHVEKGRDEK
jgi:hypothetical protein